MKKFLLFAAVLITTTTLISCGTTEEAAKAETPKEEAKAPAAVTTTVSEKAIAEASGLQAEEAGFTFAGSEIASWSLDGGKKYIHMEDSWAKLQDSSGNECTSKYATLVDAGDDKVLSLDFNYAKRGSNITLLFNYSDQGKTPKDLSEGKVKIRMYIPESMTADGFEQYPSLNLVARDSAWTMPSLGEEIKGTTLKDIGSGWQTLVIDFAAKTFELGNKKGSITPNASAVKKSNSFDIEFNSKKLAPEQTAETILIDWVYFENIK